MRALNLDGIAALQSESSADGILTCFSALIGSLGYERFLMTRLPAPPLGMQLKQFTLLNGWAEDWLDHYTANNYLAEDPIAAQAFKAVSGFAWSDVSLSQCCRRGLKIMDEAASIRMNDGFVVPIAAPGGLRAVVTMAGENPSIEPHARAYLQLLGVYAFEKLSSLDEPKNNGPLKRRLSPRERECLTWVAAGKTDRDVSDILDISEHTAKTYIRNAMRKLDVRSRPQAVAEAIRQQEIVP